MNLASIIVAFFLICLIIAVPPFGLLVALFYLIWWIVDSGKNNQCPTTEVTVTTEVPSGQQTFILTLDNAGNISNVDQIENQLESVEFVRDEKGKKWEHWEQL